MTQRTKAQRYAQAILEAVVEQWHQSLIAVDDALSQNAETRRQLENPGADLDARFEALESVLPSDASDEMKNFLKMLVQEGDTDVIRAVAQGLSSELSGEQGPTEAEIVSAVELDQDEKEKLQGQISKQYGSDLTYTYKVDPSLLGGVRVRVGDTLIDHTVASRLTEMREIIASAVR